MFILDLTQSLARMGLNALTLAAVERDALLAAAMLLERANPTSIPTSEALTREANTLLPEIADHAGSLRIFWATKRQTEDGPINDLSDMATFVSERAETLEAISNQLLDGSKSMRGWTLALARLAEAYSYVIEAALTLEQMGMIPLRRREDLKKLTAMPDQETNYAGSLLFLKAMALHTARMADEKPLDSEKFA